MQNFGLGSTLVLKKMMMMVMKKIVEKTRAARDGRV